jgi:hypothetical protein
MKQSFHPAHNMPAEEHDGTQLPIGDGVPQPTPQMMAAQAQPDDTDPNV